MSFDAPSGRANGHIVTYLRFTGFRDENSIEIYERDILSVGYIATDDRNQVQVLFEEGCWMAIGQTASIQRMRLSRLIAGMAKSTLHRLTPLTVEITGSYNAMVKWLMGNEPIGTLRGCRFFCSRLVVQHYFPGLHVHRIRCTRFEV